MLVTVFNPGRGPVLLDQVGHVIGAGEWAEANDVDPQTLHAISVGLLVVTHYGGDS